MFLAFVVRTSLRKLEKVCQKTLFIFLAPFQL
jgi:hypothetical protein